MGHEAQIMFVAGSVFIAISLLSMLSLSTTAPTVPDSGYANFTSQYAATSQSGGIFDGIPVIGNIAAALASVGAFLGNIASLLNPTAFLEGLGLPTGLAILIEGIAALLIGFGAIYLWKGVI